MKWLMRGCFILALCFHTVLIAHAQPREPQPSVFNVSPEKGVHFNSSDGFMEFRMGFRLQQQLAITQIVSEQDNLQVEYLIRRERALFRGFLFHNKLDYLVQIGMDGGSVELLNAEYTWKPDKNTRITFGQFFPPTFRQFQTTSKNLQMVDRSNVSRFFFTDYDLGIRVRRTFNLSPTFQLKTSGALTHGEGKNLKTASGGWAYMSRLEVLPLGGFTKGGDYVESDLQREITPKLSVGAGFYFNQDAYTKLGNIVWDGLEDDIFDRYVDVVFKYNGFSFQAEYIKRSVDNEVLISDGQTFYADKTSGEGFYTQAGYFVDEKIELTTRFSTLKPDVLHHNELGKFTQQHKVSMGLNYFFLGHSLKLQSQLGYVSEEFAAIKNCNYFEFLTQFTISF
ncbi:MAG: hypothetical protein JJ966_04940 [Balneolaceae bacterium]|nr:hypothetical protein [Balneolaceae bacterium]